MTTSRREKPSPALEQAFDQAESRGKSSRPAREDHTHGTPTDPATEILSSILGTASEVTVTDNGDGTITLSLPDQIKLDGVTASRLLAVDGDKLTVTVADLTTWIAGTANKVTVSDDGDGTMTITLPNSIQLDGATASRLLATDGSKRTVSADLASWVAGTANKITVTDDGDGSITLTLPAVLNVDQITPAGRLILPMGEISYFSLTGTSIAIASVSDGSTNMVKVDPTTALSGDSYEFDNGGANNGRLRYTGTTTKQFHTACTISIAPTTANDLFVFGVAKNGTVIAESKVLVEIAGASQIKSTAMHIMVELATNDYLELFVGNTTDTDDLTIHTMNLFAMGM